MEEESAAVNAVEQAVNAVEQAVNAVEQAVNEETDLFRELEQVVNRYGVGNGTNTPDYIIAGFLLETLDAWKQSIAGRDDYYAPRRTNETNGEALILGSWHNLVRRLENNYGLPVGAYLPDWIYTRLDEAARDAKRIRRYAEEAARIRSEAIDGKAAARKEYEGKRKELQAAIDATDEARRAALEALRQSEEALEKERKENGSLRNQRDILQVDRDDWKKLAQARGLALADHNRQLYDLKDQLFRTEEENKKLRTLGDGFVSHEENRRQLEAMDREWQEKSVAREKLLRETQEKLRCVEGEKKRLHETNEEWRKSTASYLKSEWAERTASLEQMLSEADSRVQYWMKRHADLHKDRNGWKERAREMKQALEEAEKRNTQDSVDAGLLRQGFATEETADSIRKHAVEECIHKLRRPGYHTAVGYLQGAFAELLNGAEEKPL